MLTAVLVVMRIECGGGVKMRSEQDFGGDDETAWVECLLTLTTQPGVPALGSKLKGLNTGRTLPSSLRAQTQQCLPIFNSSPVTHIHLVPTLFSRESAFHSIITRFTISSQSKQGKMFRCSLT